MMHLVQEREAALIWLLCGMFAAGALFGVLFMALVSVSKDSEAVSTRRREPVNARPEPLGEQG
jgi:hypothetical protein